MLAEDWCVVKLAAVIAPSPAADWTDVEESAAELRLGRVRQGRLLEKHILTFGDLFHPVTGTKIKIDKAFVDTLVKNFDKGVCDIVQVPLANDKNEHVESPGANLGEVLGIRVDEAAGKVYAQIDARQDAEKFGKTYLGASAFMHLNYKDTKTNTRVGPALLHVAVTNRPYVTGLDPYEDIVAASSIDDGGAEYSSETALLQMGAAGDVKEAAVPRTLEEILSELKSDHNLDVTSLQALLKDVESGKAAAETSLSAVQSELDAAKTELASKPDVDALAARVQAALAGTEAEAALSASDGDVDTDTIVSAVAELAQQNVALSATATQAVDRIAALEKRNLETEIDSLISEGRILPAKRDAYLELAMSNRETFDALVPDEPIVKLNAESGVSPKAEEHVKQEVDVDAELARLTAPGGPAAEYMRV